MKLESFLHALLPKEDKFFKYFEKDVDNLLVAAGVFRELMTNAISKEERAQKIKRIEELEHKGDEITHTIYSISVPPSSRHSIARIFTLLRENWMTSSTTFRGQQQD